MSKPPTGPRGVDAKTKVIHLSQLLGASVVTPSGEPIGRVDDIIVRLPSVETKSQHSRVTIVWDQPPPREWIGDRRNHHDPDEPES